MSPNTLCCHSHTLLLSGCRNRSGSLRGTTYFLAQQLMLSIIDCKKRLDQKYSWHFYCLYILVSIDIPSKINHLKLKLHFNLQQQAHVSKDILKLILYFEQKKPTIPIDSDIQSIQKIDIYARIRRFWIKDGKIGQSIWHK